MGVQERSIKPLEVMMANLMNVDASNDAQALSKDAYVAAEIARYRKKAFADNTWASYKSDLFNFICYTGVDLPFPVTPTLIREYLVIQSKKLAPTTLHHRVAALSFVHRFMGVEDPTTDSIIHQLLSGIRKERLDEGWEAKQAKALTADQFKQVIMAIEDDMRGLRDRTLLLVGLVCAFRQSELSGLQIEKLQKIEGEGYHYKVNRSKTDQEATKKRAKVIPYGQGKMCPVRAIDELLEEIGENTGPLFRGISRLGNFMLSKNKDGSTSTKGMSHTAVNSVVRKRINLAGIITESDPDKHKALLKEYSFHTLRASFITILRAGNVADSKIMKQTHHTNINIIGLYDRPEMDFENSPTSDLMAVLSE